MSLDKLLNQTNVKVLIHVGCMIVINGVCYEIYGSELREMR